MNDEMIRQIRRFVNGKMSCEDFELEMMHYPDAWQWIQSLLTEEMKEDADHPLWKKCHYRMSLETNGFRVKATISSFGMDNIVGTRMLHDVVSALYATIDPDVVIMDPPDFNQEDLMESIGLDCIGGSEADKFVQDILDALPDGITKTEKKKQAKKALKECFHIRSKKPDWVQEPEWPVKEGRPLTFLKQTSDGDLFKYEFIDVEGNPVIVEQYA